MSRTSFWSPSHLSLRANSAPVRQFLTPSGFEPVPLRDAGPVHAYAPMVRLEVREIMNKLTAMFLLAFAGATLATAAGAPEGLYLMTRIQGSGLDVSTYWFHDGAVVRNPGVSAKNLDLPGERALHANSVGTYALAGGQLTLTFPGSNIKSRFEADATGGGFGWDAGAFVPVEIFKPGATLEGTYAGGSSTGGGALMGSSSITFRRDGTYVSDSATSFASQGRSSGASGGSVS